MSEPVDPSRVPRPVAAHLAAERERTIARLQDAVAADQLELDELDERLDLALRARNQAELDVLVRDLPPLPVVVMSPAHMPALASAPATRPSPTLMPHAERINCVFSSVARRGRRVVPRELFAKSVFGSIELDLREATFEPGVSTLHCRSVFGSVEIKVPPHVRVELGGSGVFGSFEERGHNDLAATLPEAPVLRVVGKAVFGSVEVVAASANKRARLTAR